MEGPRFSFGNKQWVRDSRAVCAYPGRDNYMGLLGVTTQIGQTNTFRPTDNGQLGDSERTPGQIDPRSDRDPLGFGRTIVSGQIGEAKYNVRDCKPQ